MRFCVLAFAAVVALQDREALRQALKDTPIGPEWIYNDLEAGFAGARKSGKPMLVVFR